MRKDYSDNPLANSWRERYDMQSDAIKEKLDALKTMPVSEFQLQVIKKERKFMPEKGDVFVTSPRNSIYFYGVVVNAGIDNNNGNDLLVVMIFKDKTKSLQDINFDVDYNNLLIPPEIVGREYWTKGYFYNIGLNIQIPHNLDYGFYRVVSEKYVNEYLQEIDHIPKLLGCYGVSTISGIAKNINKEIIINESLLE